MNDKEWVMEFLKGVDNRGMNVWTPSARFKYIKDKGVIRCGGAGFECEWNRSYYRLKHIPTGKIIPGELL